MRRTLALLCAVVLVGGGPQGSFQETLSDSGLKSLKAATVLLGGARGIGTGFVFRRDGKKVWIITHSNIASGQGPLFGVWNAGTPEENSVSMKRVAVDPATSMAVLKCELKDPPSPLVPVAAARLRESQTGFLAGFPGGMAMGSGVRSPAPTISRVTVASLVADQHGALRIVQLDGQTLPGHGGGPVVDARGGLIGMASHSVSDTRVSFAVASTEITELLEGRAFPPLLLGGSGDEKSVKVRITTGVVDPLDKIRQTVLLLVPRIKVPDPLKPGDGGVWGPISDTAAEFPLKVAEGDVDQEITVPKGESEGGRFLAQIRYSRGGTTRWTAPVEAQFDFTAKAPPPKPEDRPPAPPPSPSPEVELDVRVDDSGRDAELSFENGAQDALRQRVYVWKDRGHPASHIVSPDRKTLYAVDVTQDRGRDSAKTTVRMINLETWREDRSVTLGRAFGEPQWGPSGLVLTSRQARGDSVAVVLDPKSLHWIRSYTGFGNELITHPLSPMGVSGSGEWLTFFDLAKNTVANRISLKQVLSRKDKPKVSPKGAVAGSFKKLGWTPDGKWLIVADASCLHRFRIQGGTDVVYEEAGMKIGGDVSFLLGPDSASVLILGIPRETEKYREKGKELERVRTLVDERWLFRIGNLGAPSVKLRPFNAGHPFAFDPAGSVIFARAGHESLHACRRLVKIGIGGGVLAEYDGVALPTLVEAVSPTRLLAWDMGLRVWDLPK